MVVKKYFGKTTRDALRQVRHDLGSDALILSNRPLPSGGVEIMAVADADVSVLAQSLASTTLNQQRQPNKADEVNSAALDMMGDAPAPASTHSVGNALARTYALPVEPMDEAPAPINRKALDDAGPAPARPTFPSLESRLAAERAREQAHTNEVEAQPKPVEFKDSVIGRYEGQAAAQPTNSTPRPREEGIPELFEKKAEPDPTAQRLEIIDDELKLLRSLLQGQLASLAWANFEDHEPMQAELFRQLLAIGMSPALCRQLVARLPGQFGDEAAVKWAKSALAHNVLTITENKDIISRGGVYALVGPTGVGKTTTVAKLAARATIRHGSEQVALITTDSYRIGAQDQLKLYGKILGVSVYSVQNEADLQATLYDLRDKHIVLIDSVGMGQRDNRVASQTEMFANASQEGKAIERILLLAANADGHTLEDVAQRYRGTGLAGCVLSKLDEAVSLGSCLDTIVRHRLPVYYVTNGQRVPEDLHQANAAFLVDRAFKVAREASPYSLKSDEYQLLQAAQASWN